MLKSKVSIFKRFSLALVAAVMTFWACQLTQNGTTVDSLSFTNLYDSLTLYESVTIVIKAKDGTVMDTIYQGKVDTYAEIEKLRVKGWDGGEILVEIIGFNGGVAVYKVQKDFDGKTDRTNSTSIIFVPGTTLSSNPKDVLIFEGDSLLLPSITITPANLSNKRLIWKSSNQAVLVINDRYLKGMQVGLAELTVALQADTTRTFVFKVSVERNTKIPESLTLSAESLFVATAGAAEHLSVVASPFSASKAVTWTLLDPTLASVDSNGAVIGIKKGATVLKATSKKKSSIFDTAWVIISDPVPVEKVRFLKDSTEIFIRGAAEKLLVEVLPSKSNPAVEFVVIDPLKLRLTNGNITGLVEGSTSVIVKSKENPLLMDTLLVRVSATQIVDSVRISPRTLKLFTGGESATLIGKILPNSASSKIQWSSTNSDIASVDASGKVSPKTPGNIKIRAISLADSLKQDSIDVVVKHDPAQMTIGSDTVISVGQTLAFLPVVPLQEYGVVTQFKWDLDGNLVWDDSSATVKSVSYKFDTEKEYTVGFYVRDTEGNETVVTKKVRAVVGPRVNISSPTNNSYSRVAKITVTWTVNDTVQALLTTETLKEGPNTITRTVKDAAGTPFSTSVVVTLDSMPPNKPVVKGSLLISNTQPTWIWQSGGLGGNGMFRFALDIENFATAPEVKDTLYKTALGLTEDPHTLFVQERDVAGNWSTSGRFTTNIDLSAPAIPVVKVSTPATSNNPKPVWSWTGSGTGPGVYQYKVDNSDFTSGAIETAELTFTPATNMLEGLRTVYVREKDSAGNWSELGKAQVTLDFTPPTKPVITGSSPTSTNPNWKWTSGGGGGSGDFRFKLGADPTAADAETRLLEYTLTTVVSGSTYTLYVQERDAAGNWSTSSSLPIKHDISKPSVNILLPIASESYTMSAATTAISGGSGGENTITKVSYTYTVTGGTGGSGTAVLATTGGAWSIASIPLTEGKTTLVTIRATDALGNFGEAMLSIIRDSMPPQLPSFVDATTTASPTRNRAPIWTWSSGGGGNGTFRYQLGSAPPVISSTTTFSGLGLSDGTYTLTVAERDTIGNWSNNASRSIQIKGNAPLAPIVSINASTTNVPQWNWISGGGGDIKIFRYKLDAGSYPATGSNGLSYAPTNLTDGSRNLCVQEQDLLGWGPETCTTIIVDKTGPEIIITTKDKITNQPSIVIDYTVDGVSKNYTCPLTDNILNLCKIIEKDALGNESNKEVPIWRKSTVIFVKAGGSGNGSSWDNASGDLIGKIQNSNNVNKEIWVAEGTYSGAFSPVSGTKIFGGFTPSAYPVNTTARSLYSTTFSGQVHSVSSGGGSIDGIIFEGSLHIALGTYTITDCQFKTSSPSLGHAIYVENSGHAIVKNILIQNSEFSESIIMVDAGATALFQGGQIVSNKSHIYPSIFVNGGDVEIIDTFTFSLNTVINNTLDGGTLFMNAGTLKLGLNVDLDCHEIIFYGGTATCGGHTALWSDWPQWP
jgi:hypothetical protein